MQDIGDLCAAVNTCNFCQHTEISLGKRKELNHIPTCPECGKTNKEWDDKVEKENREDIKELGHWYGWDELRKIIDEIEEGENEDFDPYSGAINY